MKSFAPVLLLAASAAAQLQPAALPLSADPWVVDADVIVFRLDVLAPQGVWLDDQNAFGDFAYVMEASWMSLASDQQPLQSRGWSFPSLAAGNQWAYGQIFVAPQHLRAGSYLLAMADDSHDPFRDPSPVVPTAVPTTFSDGCIAVTGIGYAIDASLNAVFERPPFVNHTLQPCDLTGEFPYLTYVGPGAPHVTLTWEAGSQTDTCSGFTGFPSLAGFNGACGRWIIRNMATGVGHADPVDLLMSNETLTIGGPQVLPDAALGLLLLGLEPAQPAIVDLDLDLVLPGLFPRHDSLRYLNWPVIWPMTLVTTQQLRAQFSPGPDPTLIGQAMMMQGVAFSATLEGATSDLHSITFW